jgi:hypothetical protein
MSSGAVSAPLIEGDTKIFERRAIHKQSLALGPEYGDKLRREIEYLPELGLSSAYVPRQLILLGDIYSSANDALTTSHFACRDTDATYMTDRAVESHDTFREVKAAIARQHLTHLLRHEPAIFWMDQSQVFVDSWWLGTRLKSMNLKQFGAPVLESGSVECPATRVRKPLAFGKIELGPLVFFYIDVNPNPTEQLSITRAKRFRTTKKPVVASFSIT